MARTEYFPAVLAASPWVDAISYFTVEATIKAHFLPQIFNRQAGLEYRLYGIPQAITLALFSYGHSWHLVSFHAAVGFILRFGLPKGAW
jgi:hypothetical protein